MSTKEFELEFGEFVPHDLQDGVIYFSMDYATASHLCACGCGERVVTPLDAQGWVLTFDGTATLSKSIGSGQLSCQSHYLIVRNRVEWCRPMTRTATAAARAIDLAEREEVHRSPNLRDRIARGLRRWASPLRKG